MKKVIVLSQEHYNTILGILCDIRRLCRGSCALSVVVAIRGKIEQIGRILTYDEDEVKEEENE